MRRAGISIASLLCRGGAEVIPVGLGVDIVEISEMASLVDDQGWLARCFTRAEIDEFPDGPHRVAHIAGRFAAKEAVLKALGTGQGDGIAFSDAVIDRSKSGQPLVRLVGGAELAAKDLQVSQWLLSISHSKGIAVASAIAFSS